MQKNTKNHTEFV